jgi:hypothetical protein
MTVPPKTTLFLWCQMFWVIIAINSNSSLSNQLLNCSKIVRKSPDSIAHLWRHPLHSIQTAGATLHHHSEWIVVLISIPHVGQPGLLTTFRLNYFSLVGRMSLQALHKNSWTAQGTWNLQISCHIGLALGFTEILPLSHTLLSTAKWYALRTENVPVLVPLHMSWFGVVRGLVAMLQLCSTTSAGNRLSIIGTFRQLSSYLISSLTHALLSSNWLGTWILCVDVACTHLSHHILIFVPSPTFHSSPSSRRDLAFQMLLHA